MKSLSRSLTFAALAVTVLSFVSLAPAHADPLTPDQSQHIVSTCTSMKSTLNQLHVSDTLLRVNRGQFYESMSSKLMTKFNARLSNNGIDNNAFVTITNDYSTALNNFRIDYISYEQQLTNTINIDCTKQPSTFNDAVMQARTLRNKVHDDVTNLNSQITSYQTGVNAFLGTYDQPAGVTQ